MNAVISNRQVFDFAEPKLCIFESGLGCVLAGFPYHFRGHINSDYLSGVTNGPGREKTIEPASAPKFYQFLNSYQLITPR